MTLEAHQRWLDCTCGTCLALAYVAHDKAAWDTLFEQTKQCCPTWSQPVDEAMGSHPVEDDPRGQLTLNGV